MDSDCNNLKDTGNNFNFINIYDNLEENTNITDITDTEVINNNDSEKKTNESKIEVNNCDLGKNSKLSNPSINNGPDENSNIFKTAILDEDEVIENIKISKTVITDSDENVKASITSVFKENELKYIPPKDRKIHDIWGISIYLITTSLMIYLYIKSAFILKNYGMPEKESFYVEFFNSITDEDSTNNLNNTKTNTAEIMINEKKLTFVNNNKNYNDYHYYNNYINNNIYNNTLNYIDVFNNNNLNYKYLISSGDSTFKKNENKRENNDTEQPKNDTEQLNNNDIEQPKNDSEQLNNNDIEQPKNDSEQPKNNDIEQPKNDSEQPKNNDIERPENNELYDKEEEIKKELENEEFNIEEEIDKVEEVKDSKYLIFLLYLISVSLTFVVACIYLSFLLFLHKILAMITVIGVYAVGSAIGIYFFYKWIITKIDNNKIIIASCSGVFLIITILVAIFFYLFRKRILFALKILNYSLMIIKKHYSIVLLNITVTLYGCLVNYFIVNILYSIVAYFDNTATEQDKVKILTYRVNIKEVIYILVLLFLYFYNNEVLKNLIHTVVSGVIYFTFYKSYIDFNPVFKSLFNSIFKNLGSICIGSILAALIRVLDGGLKIFETIFIIPMFIKSKFKSFCFFFKIIGHIIYLAAIGIIFPFYLVILLLEYFIKLIEYGMKYFNFYTFTNIAMEGKSYLQASIDTFTIVNKYKNNALINDYLVRYLLLAGQYFVITVGVIITKFIADYIGIEKSNLIIYVTGVTLIFKKLFASITQAVLSSTVAIFVIFIRTGIVEKFEKDIENDKKNKIKKDNVKNELIGMLKKNYYKFDFDSEGIEEMQDLFDVYTGLYGDPIDIIKEYHNKIVSNFLNEQIIKAR